MSTRREWTVDQGSESILEIRPHGRPGDWKIASDTPIQKAKVMQHSRVRCLCVRNEEYNNGLQVVWEYYPVCPGGVQYGYKPFRSGPIRLGRSGLVFTKKTP